MRKPILEGGLIVGNTYDKYRTRNPIARTMVQGSLQASDEAVEIFGGHWVLEVGCGEGELSIRMSASGRSVFGTDISSLMVAEAVGRAEERGVGVGFSQADLFEPDAKDGICDLVVCCEVLEHPDDPEAALCHLTTLMHRRLLVSVPRQPLWRILNMAPGKYLGALGNTPGHLQHWSEGSLLGLLRRHCEVAAERTPLP